MSNDVVINLPTEPKKKVKSKSKSTAHPPITTPFATPFPTPTPKLDLPQNTPVTLSYHQYIFRRYLFTILCGYHIIICITIYDIYMVPYDLGFNWDITLNILAVLTLTAFYRVIKTAPGFVQQDWVTKAHADYYMNLPICPECKVIVPLRSFHCKRLKKCILRFDHYCSFTGNSIGINNHKFFILFLLYGAVATTMVQLCIVRIFYNYYSDKNIHWTIWYMALQNGFFWLFCNLLCFIHSVLLLSNITFKEFFNWYRACRSQMRSWRDIPREYNQGIYKNISSIIGTDPLVWLCPWKYTVREDGYFWQVHTM